MINSSELVLDYTVSSFDTINLTSEQIEQAANLSDSATEIDMQWQAYLNALALLGFELWLHQRSPELILQIENNVTIFNTIYQLKVGEFKLCLLTQNTLEDVVIPIPKIVVDSANGVAHFYILVTVDEEQEEISITGVLHYNQMKRYQQSGKFSLQSEPIYEIPLDCFDSDVNHLLLYLRCLEASAIQLPDSLRETANQNIRGRLSQPVINVALWLQEKLDETAESLSWLLLPTPELTTASFRSPSLFESIIEELVDQGLSIPHSARNALLDFNLGETALQLYSLVWVLTESNEWSILFILGTPNDRNLPVGLSLQIRDDVSLLNEQNINSTSDQAYLYTRVIGEPSETFTVSINLSNGANFTLPPFTFVSEQSS